MVIPGVLAGSPGECEEASGHLQLWVGRGRVWGLQFSADPKLISGLVFLADSSSLAVAVGQGELAVALV